MVHIPVTRVLRKPDFSQDSVFEMVLDLLLSTGQTKPSMFSVEHDYLLYKSLCLKEELNLKNLSLDFASNEVLVSNPEKAYEALSGLTLSASLVVVKLLSSAVAIENLNSLSTSTKRIRNSGSFNYLPSEYLMSLPNSGQSFDIIIVDGMNRALRELWP